MDLVTVDVTGADVAEGDWLPLALDIPALARAGAVSQYELLVALSRRYERSWT
jgi:alanine racemase